MLRLIKTILIGTLLLITSCNDSFLERPALDRITSDSYWKTANDLNLYVTQFYTAFPSWSPGAWNGGIYWTDRNSDNLVGNNPDTRLMGNNTIQSGNNRWDYGDIRAVNVFFSNYEKVSATPEQISQYVGEAYFFRAFFYFRLLKDYGGVPFITSPLESQSDELYSQRTPRNELVAHILTDLDEAIDKLPTGPVSDGNRLSREVAQLFKARVALFEGTWEKYHANTEFGISGSDGSSFLTIAAETSENLIDNPGNYGVYSSGNPNADYWVLFNQTEYTGHPEVMLWRDYDVNLGIAHNGQRYLPRIGGGLGLTKKLVETYLCADGQPISASGLYLGDESLLTIASNRDPRLSQTMFLPGHPMEQSGNEVTKIFEQAPLGQAGSAGCTTGYMIYKGANPDPIQYYTGGVGTTSSPVFRFAEALLIFAEAKAELGAVTQDDLDKSINLLRSRVNMPPLKIESIVNDPNWDFPNLSPLLNEIRRERQIEFALEGYRFDDIMRWAAADEVIIGERFRGVLFQQEEFPDLVVGADVLLDDAGYVDPHQGQLPNGHQFDLTRDYLLPVPQQELTLNPNLTQNPGW
ncbi:MAG: RagB/SusD family nutrient uptake outer membrane protein [Cyclobacterium sp.]|uniref:RagB/SusD family nutrient uptake outer membrane protein n=1 Tax=Cyclobacterium sp. TaxID=1966343 RepID=UPI003970F1E1